MDKISRKKRSDNMKSIRSKDTKPELIVRKLTYSLGYRYRLHKRNLPGKPDLVFISRKKAIFIHGCFWHQHQDPKCKSVHIPKSRVDYWIPKLERNVIRDQEHQKNLTNLGWEILIIWECQLNNLDNLSIKIQDFLGPSRL